MSEFVLLHVAPALPDPTNTRRMLRPSVRTLGGAKTLEDAQKNAAKALERNPDVDVVTIRSAAGDDVGTVERD